MRPGSGHPPAFAERQPAAEAAGGSGSLPARSPAPSAPASGPQNECSFRACRALCAGASHPQLISVAGVPQEAQHLLRAQAERRVHEQGVQATAAQSAKDHALRPCQRPHACMGQASGQRRACQANVWRGMVARGAWAAPVQGWWPPPGQAPATQGLAAARWRSPAGRPHRRGAALCARRRPNPGTPCWRAGPPADRWLGAQARTAGRSAPAHGGCPWGLSPSGLATSASVANPLRRCGSTGLACCLLAQRQAGGHLPHLGEPLGRHGDNVLERPGKFCAGPEGGALVDQVVHSGHRVQPAEQGGLVRHRHRGLGVVACPLQQVPDLASCSRSATGVQAAADRLRGRCTAPASARPGRTRPGCPRPA